MILLAAGLGRRFGGPKQLEPVGPADEPLFVVTGRDALDAGFERLVVVTRSDLERRIRSVVERYLPAGSVDVVLQDRAGPERVRPFGTAYAVASCASVVHGPVGVANADDHYGRASVEALASAVAVLGPDDAVVVGYRLRGTLSPHGPVNRAVCAVEPDGNLVGLRERYGLVADGADGADGAGVVDVDGSPVGADEWVSMNLVGLGGAVLTRLAERAGRFATQHPDDDEEIVLSDELAALIDAGLVRARLVPARSRWVGVTHRADLPSLRAAIRAAH